ncbi:MAG: hypothetical protein ACI85U_003067 [Candidatus Promineifilaceae bacterium]|jgi:hypothetical protein
MSVLDIVDWLNDQSETESVWFIKRLSSNDTLRNNSHQAGPYIPKDIFFEIFPSLNRKDIKNPDLNFETYIDSHLANPNAYRTLRAVYYNNKFHADAENKKGTRNEARITGFGGALSPLLDPENTGSLAIFVFQNKPEPKKIECHIWVCEHETEADLVEDRVGPIPPEQAGLVIHFGKSQPNLQGKANSKTNCFLELDELPKAWLIKFPTGQEIVSYAIKHKPLNSDQVDKRLLRRRECEFEIFQSIEHVISMPRIDQGFPTLKEFLDFANSILQRRKSRGGRSLELQLKAIFEEEGLIEGKNFSYQAVSEGRKKPDFLFPSQSAYQDKNFPSDDLRMLAVKSTVKDRWRQVLNEADRIKTIHLLTLQKGVSEAQYQEMCNYNVQLVVPEPLKKEYPKAIQQYLMSLEDFLADIRMI